MGLSTQITDMATQKVRQSKNDDRLKEVLQTVGMDYAGMVLELTQEPVSAEEISEEGDIPIATVYRRISALKEIGLIEVHEGRNERDRKIEKYQRTCNSIVFRFYSDSDA